MPFLKKALAAALGCALLAGAPFALAERGVTEDYQFGLFPFLPPARLEALYGLVAQDLGQALEHPVSFSTRITYEKFEAALAGEVYEIALINPFQYIEVAARRRYVPLARAAEPLTGLFLVRQNSPIRRLEDLRGQTLGFPPRSSTVTRQGLLHLGRHGLQPDSFVTHYFDSHDSCIQAVQNSKVACCITTRVPALFYERDRGVKFETIAQTDPMPNVLFVAHKNVADAYRARLLERILSWTRTGSGRRLLEQMATPTGFVPAQDGDYDPVRKLASAEAGAVAQAPYTLGFTPFLPPARLEQFAGRVATAFGEALGRPVQFRTKPSFAQYSEALTQGLYDIALVNAFDYVEAAAPNGYGPLARLDEPFTATVVVKPGSLLSGLRDLRGRRLALPQEGTAALRMLPLLLRSAGLKETDLSLQQHGSHEGCYQATLRGAADACLTQKVPLELFQKQSGLQLKVLGDSPAIPSVVFVAHRRLPAGERARLLRAILSWVESPPAEPLVRDITVGAFVAAFDSDYDVLRRQLREAR